MNYELISQKSFRNITGYGSDADARVKKAVIAGIKFLEENPTLLPARVQQKLPTGMEVFPPTFIENSDMGRLRQVVSPLMYGGSGAMYEMAVSVVMFWKEHGTEKTLLKLE